MKRIKILDLPRMADPYRPSCYHFNNKNIRSMYFTYYDHVDQEWFMEKQWLKYGNLFNRDLYIPKESR